MKKYYSVIWYTEIDENGKAVGDYEKKDFKTKQQALSFYNNHKNDTDKYYWWVITRDDEDDFIC